MDQSQFGSPPSGLPPLAYLSGLNLGQGGMSGAMDPSLAGGGAQGPGGPGMTGGLSLAELSALLAAMQGAGEVAGPTAGIPIGNVPGIGGTIGQGTLAGGGVAGSPTAGAGQGGGFIAGQSTGGGIDPMQIIKQALGLAQKGAGALGGVTIGGAEPTAGYSGVSLSDQLRSQQTPTASPIGGYGTIGAGGLPLPGTQTQPVLGPGGVPVTGFGENVPGGISQQYVNQAQAGGGFPIPPDLAALGVTQDNLPQFLSAVSGMSPEQIAQFQAEAGMGGIPNLPTQGYATAGANTVSGTPGTPGTNLGGVAQGGLSGALGLINLLQGAQGGNIAQSLGGALGTAGGLTQLLQSSPELAKMLGLDSGVLGTAGGTIGGLGGLLNLAQGIQSGNPLQIGSGVLGTAQGAQTLYSLLTEGGTQGAGVVASMLAQYAPQLATQLASTFGSEAAGTAAASAAAAGNTASLASTLAPALSGAAAAAAPIIAAITSYFGAMEEKQARESGWANNPILGQLYSSATGGVANANALLQQIAQAGIGNIATPQLESLLPSLLNQLEPYYATAQGPAGALKPSDIMSGIFGRPGIGGEAQYTQNFTQAQQGVEGVVQELLNRGVSYEDIGKLQLGFNPAYAGLNMADAWPMYYAPQAAQWNAQANTYLQPSLETLIQGAPPFGGYQDIVSQSGPGLLMGGDIQGGRAIADASRQANLITEAFGGPVWTYLARMGYDPGGIIQQHFNPWAIYSGWTPEQVQEAAAPGVEAAGLRLGELYQAYTSGGS